MGTIARFVIGSIAGLVGLIALFIASRADSTDGIHAAALIVFAFAVFYIFFLIKRGYDLAERDRPHPSH